MQRLLSDQFNNTGISNIRPSLLKDICGFLVKTNAEWWKKDTAPTNENQIYRLAGWYLY